MLVKPQAWRMHRDLASVLPLLGHRTTLEGAVCRLAPVCPSLLSDSLLVGSLGSMTLKPKLSFPSLGTKSQC